MSQNLLSQLYNYQRWLDNELKLHLLTFGNEIPVHAVWNFKVLEQ